MSTRTAPPGVTADDILTRTKELIVRYGWQRMAWPHHGPAPRCLIAALYRAAQDCSAEGTAVHVQAKMRLSEAIYGRDHVGGVIDWEYRKRTDQEAVVAMLQRAIEMGPSGTPEQGALWPT